ncbi:hypothetical protein MLD38_033444 [Melastoma candidum]|uniref:Uncharacterized protein n=1 Tax=Melastoma candidum TaxID=119954 RepID=A0ACB9M6S6_9MYRT|nr:hypothetical protein MLD38_033444 [Melastoma candidum]
MLSHITFWLFILLPVYAVPESLAAREIDQTDLHKAFRDMRTRSYHGFVILLRLMDVASSLQNSNVTFLMPDNGDLSQLSITQRNLEDFVLSHTIPSPLTMEDLIHLPNGTLVPTSLPKRMINITSHGNSGLYLNNAHINLQPTGHT